VRVALAAAVGFLEEEWQIRRLDHWEHRPVVVLVLVDALLDSDLLAGSSAFAIAPGTFLPVHSSFKRGNMANQLMIDERMELEDSTSIIWILFLYSDTVTNFLIRELPRVRYCSLLVFKMLARFVVGILTMTTAVVVVGMPSSLVQ
jgi:hypothetical protein